MIRTLQLWAAAMSVFGALAAPAVAQQPAPPACPPTAFTIVGIEQPDGPGRNAVMTVDVPGPGRIEIQPDDGGFKTGEEATAARMALPLSTSEANARKYSGGTQSEAGQPVTVGYTVTYTRRMNEQCTRPDGSTGFDASTTQTTSYTFVPNPLKTVRLTFSTTGTGRFAATLACSGMDVSVCNQHAFEIDLGLSESTYRRYVKFLPDDNLLDEFAAARGGRASFSFTRDTLAGLRRIKSVKATLGIRLQGVRGDDRGLRTPKALEKTVTIRRGKVAKTTFTMTNAKLGDEM